jgi:nicotinamide-nucleotide amidase
MTVWPADIEDHARSLVEALAEKNLRVATAESCTGGLVAAALTEIAGSSAVVDRGFVTYSNAAKMALLKVSDATLALHGAVSQETAIEMARGALAASDAEVAIAVTGIAGPSGGSAEKPVGLVHLAAMRRDGPLRHREMRYGDIGRHAIRLATVRTALEMLSELGGA